MYYSRHNRSYRGQIHSEANVHLTLPKPLTVPPEVSDEDEEVTPLPAVQACAEELGRLTPDAARQQLTWLHQQLPLR